MPFHVEVSSSLNDARVFNLDEAELLETVLDPWVVGLSFEFGGREWQPRESRLTILEGPVLNSPDPAWSNALRAAEDVTRPMLEAAEANAPVQAAMVVEADSLEAALKGLRTGRSPRPVHWSAMVERINERDADITAVILVVKR
jgi:hypothetical protein